VAAFAIVLSFTVGQASGGDRAKILGGSVDKRTDNPWVAAILLDPSVRSGSGYERQFCTGSLIAPRWVITAAHCVTDDNGRQEPAGNFNALIGQKNLNANPATGPGELFDIVRVRRFPGYNARTFRGDAALLKLEAASAIQPVELIGRPPRAGKRGYIAGWGDRRPYNSDNSDYPVALHSAYIPTISNRRCARSPVHAGDPFDRATMFCAGTRRGRPDTCGGDSGGPFAIYIKSAPRPWRLAGLTSFGDCGRGAPHYGVYAKVGAGPLKKWVNSIVG
jgi:secreted trypsin-like serine protease